MLAIVRCLCCRLVQARQRPARPSNAILYMSRACGRLARARWHVGEVSGHRSTPPDPCRIMNLVAGQIAHGGPPRYSRWTVRFCRRAILLAVVASVVCVPPLTRARQHITPPDAPSQEATRFNPRADGVTKRVSVTAAFVLVRMRAEAAFESAPSMQFVHTGDAHVPSIPSFHRPNGLRAPPHDLYV